MRPCFKITLAAVAALLASCAPDPYENLDEPRDFFERERIGSSPDYAIIKFRNPDDHVITIHGFADDQAACKEVADALNANACKETGGQNCLNPYTCEALNQ